MMISAKKADGKVKALECSNSGELRVLLCGMQADGTITPVLVDADGKLVMIQYCW